MVTAPVKLDATNAVATTTVKVQPHRPPLQRGGMLPVEGAENSCTHPNMTQTAENQMSANTQRYAIVHQNGHPCTWVKRSSQILPLNQVKHEKRHCAQQQLAHKSRDGGIVTYRGEATWRCHTCSMPRLRGRTGCRQSGRSNQPPTAANTHREHSSLSSETLQSLKLLKCPPNANAYISSIPVSSGP